MAGDQTVLAIDPGSLKLGWAVLRGSAVRVQRIDSGTLRMPQDLGVAERLGRLLVALTSLFDRHAVDALAIEAAFVHANPHTALVLGQARGLPIALAAARGLPVHEYPPALVKRAVVGSGRAEKAQVQQLVALMLGLAEVPAEDEADALAVGLTHLRRTALDAALPGRAASVLQAAAEVPMTPARALYARAVADAQRSARPAVATRRAR